MCLRRKWIRQFYDRMRCIIEKINNLNNGGLSLLVGRWGVRGCCGTLLCPSSVRTRTFPPLSVSSQELASAENCLSLQPGPQAASEGTKAQLPCANLGYLKCHPVSEFLMELGSSSDNCIVVQLPLLPILPPHPQVAAPDTPQDTHATRPTYDGNCQML